MKKELFLLTLCTCITPFTHADGTQPKNQFTVTHIMLDLQREKEEAIRAEIVWRENNTTQMREHKKEYHSQKER